MAVKHPKTGPSIMFFAILMSDGPISALPSRKIPGHAGNDEESRAENDERTLPCHLDRVPLCHLDRAERVERSPHPAFHPRKHSAHLPERNDRPSDNFLGDFMSDGAENGGKTPQNGTVHHVFRHFDVGRSERQHFPEETYTG